MVLRGDPPLVPVRLLTVNPKFPLFYHTLALLYANPIVAVWF